MSPLACLLILVENKSDGNRFSSLKARTIPPHPGDSGLAAFIGTHYSKNWWWSARGEILEFHDFSSLRARVEAGARVLPSSVAILAPSNRRAETLPRRLCRASPAPAASSPRRTRRLSAVPALSTLRMLASGRDAPLAETRIGLASGLRGDLRPPPARPVRRQRRCPFPVGSGIIPIAKKQTKERTAL